MRNTDKWEPHSKQNGASEAWGVRSESGAPVIPASYRLDGQDADLICRSHNARLAGRDDEIFHKAIVSHRTGLPAYQFQLGDVSWEMDVWQLRRFIADLYELAEAGVTDSFIHRWVTERLMPSGSPEEQQRMIYGIFQEFRGFRELLRNPVAEADSDVKAS